MPRIVAGTAGGIRLKAPDGAQTRPTAGRVKEALFSILQTRWPPDGFLDLYGGSGQVGLEAASRGAGRTVIVERDRPTCQVIADNLDRTGLADQVQLICADVSRALVQLQADSQRFDLVFLDPPYPLAARAARRVIPLIVPLLRPRGLVIFEHDAALDLSGLVTDLQRFRSCQYGSAMLSFYSEEAAQ